MSREGSPKVDRWLVVFYTRIQTLPVRRGRLKVLVTSRPDDDIQHQFEKIPTNLPVIRLREKTRMMPCIPRLIDLFINGKVEDLAAEFNLAQDAVQRLRIRILE